MNDKTKTTKELLADYNEKAEAVGAPTLSNWKGSKAQLIDKMGLLPKPRKNGKPKKKDVEKAIDGVSLADLAREAEKNPKVVRARFRRLYQNPEDGMPMPLDESRWVFAEKDRDAVAQLVG